MSEAPTRWTNWAGTHGCSPARFESPSTQDEMVAVVRSSVERRERVKVIGSGHSFNDIACTDGCMVRLDDYNQVLNVDRDAATITAQSGITILQLSDALAHFGLAMENMGDVGYQTISGAISTATHGTGGRFRNISSQVVGLSLVTASGEVFHCSPDHDPDTFKAAQVGVGALGILSTVTLRCVPGYNVCSVQEPRQVDGLLDQFDELCATNDHFEFFWWPHTQWAQAIMVHGLDAQGPCGGRGAETYEVAVHLEVARVGVDDTGEDFDEGGLARPVVADYRCYRAYGEVEGYLLYRGHSAVRLGYVANCERGTVDLHRGMVNHPLLHLHFETLNGDPLSVKALFRRSANQSASYSNGGVNPW